MVSVWGSRGRNDQARAEEGDRPVGEHEDSSAAPDSREPDEQTRLLLRGSSDGYLSPDDPAVSFTEHPPFQATDEANKI